MIIFITSLNFLFCKHLKLQKSQDQNFFWFFIESDLMWMMITLVAFHFSDTWTWLFSLWVIIFFSAKTRNYHIGINKRSEVRLIIRPSSPRRRFVLFFPFRLVVGLIMRPTSAHFVQNPSQNETRLNLFLFLIIRSYFKTILINYWNW